MSNEDFEAGLQVPFQFEPDGDMLVSAAPQTQDGGVSTAEITTELSQITPIEAAQISEGVRIEAAFMLAQISEGMSIQEQFALYADMLDRNQPRN